MKRSFGFGGSNMGGGRGGSVRMLRSIQRVCKASVGVGEGISRPTLNSTTTGNYSDNKNKVAGGNSSVLTLSSFTSSPSKTTASAVNSTWPACQSPTLSDESDGWEVINGFENEIEQQNCYDEVIFGRPPSSDEVQQAFQSLHGFIESSESSASSEVSIQSYYNKAVAYQVSSPTGSLAGDSPFLASSDCEEPSPHLCNSVTLSSRRVDQDDVYNAVILLQKDHDIQQIVESISNDEAVWDAVKNNEVVRELRRAYLQADINYAEESNGDSVVEDSVIESTEKTDIISWVVIKVKSKITDLMNNITKILDQLLHHHEQEDGGGNDAEKNVDHFDRKVKLSLVVTVALFLAVVLQRMKLAGNSST